MLNEIVLEGNERLMYDLIHEVDDHTIDTPFITWYAKTRYYHEVYGKSNEVTREQFDAIEKMFNRIYPLYLEDKVYPH